MLKRSFAEFHAQRSQPEKLLALTKGQRALEGYKSAPWPSCLLGCSKEELQEYYSLSARIQELTSALQVRDDVIHDEKLI